MTPKAALFATTWVHAFEEDTPDAAVYRPDTGDLPRSRRPRQRLKLTPDGSATLVVSGPDDRLQEVEAHWTEEHGEITVTAKAAPDAPIRMSIWRAGADRLLLVRR